MLDDKTPFSIVFYILVLLRELLSKMWDRNNTISTHPINNRKRREKNRIYYRRSSFLKYSRAHSGFQPLYYFNVISGEMLSFHLKLWKHCHWWLWQSLMQIVSPLGPSRRLKQEKVQRNYRNWAEVICFWLWDLVSLKGPFRSFPR